MSHSRMDFCFYVFYYVLLLGRSVALGVVLVRKGSKIHKSLSSTRIKIISYKMSRGKYTDMLWVVNNS